MLELFLTCFKIKPYSILKLSFRNTCNHLKLFNWTKLLWLNVFKFLEKHFQRKLIELNASFLNKSWKWFFSICAFSKTMFKTKSRLPKWMIFLWNRNLEIRVFKFRGNLFFIISILNEVKNYLQIIKDFRLAIWKIKFFKTFEIHRQFICSILLILCVKQFNKKDIHSWSDSEALN